MEIKDLIFPPECQKELVVEQKIYRSTSDFRLTEADVEKARKELKETEEGSKALLRQLKEQLSHENIQYRLDDVFLLRYLRHNKFDCQRAYKQLRKFYITRNENADLFCTPINIEWILNKNIMNLMPYRDEDGCLIFMGKIGKWNPDEISVLDLLTSFCNVAQIICMNPHFQVNGVIDIFDFGGLSTKHISKIISSKLMLLTVKILQELYPVRVKRILIFNCNALIYATWASFRYLFKKKVSERLKFLRNDVREIHEYINPALLPKEYGGSLENEECYSYLTKVVLNNNDYLKYEQSFIKKNTC